MKLRTLVVGSGWGEHAAGVFAADERTRLVGLVGRGSERTRALAERLAVPAFTDIGEAIRAAAPEVAAVAVNERDNPAIVRALLEAGCHVLCSHPVAASAEEVRALEALGQAHARLVATDYTLRLRPGFLQTRAALATSGALLRASIESPGRALVMAADLAVGIGGPIVAVFASPPYPAALHERLQRTPKAFPPTLLFEHRAGCVTVAVPVPHAGTQSAHRITLSAERARIDLGLPSGPARVTRRLSQGRVEEQVLLSPEPAVSATEAFAGPMRELARRFLDSVVGGVPVHAPLAEEAHVREVWAAAQRSSRERRLVDVAG